MYKITLLSRKLFLLVVFLLCSIASIAHSEIKTNTSITNATLEERIQDELEQLLKQVLSQLNSIDSILEELALLVNNDQVSKGDNKKEIVDSIRSLRGLIDKIKSDTFVTIDLPSIYLMLKLNNALMNHIGQALLKGFHELPPFDLEKTIAKHLQTEVGLEKISDTLTANNEKLAELNKLSHDAGLHWYNHAYRSFNEHVLQPAEKYRVGKIACWSTAFLFGVWWISNSERLPWLRKLVGFRPEIKLGYKGLDDNFHDGVSLDESMEMLRPKVQNINECFLAGKITAEQRLNGLVALGIDPKRIGLPKPIRILGNIWHWAVQEHQGYVPFVGTFLTLAYASFSPEIQRLLDWGKKKAKATENHLKGGIHEKEYEGITKKNPDIDFSNVIGNEKAKTEGFKVVKYMEDPERYDRFRMQVERGILLIGKTRTGKTYFAEALAGEIKKIMKEQGRNTAELGFYNIKASLIVKHGIEYILNMAKKEAPCVLFIDEIDLLALQRVGGDKDMLYAFLTSMSGCFERDLDKRVIIIGATNNPQNLDRALKARGRFGMILEFTYPEFHERKLCLEKHLNALTLNMKSFDLDKLARETEGCSYEALLAIIREAFLQAKIKGAPINQALLEHALDTAVRNIIFENQKDLPEHEQHIIAAHIAGHALAAALLPTHKKVAKVTTLPVLNEIEEEAIWDTYAKKDKEGGAQKDERVTQYGKIFTYHDKDTLALSDETEKLRLCTIELAGHMAEKVLLGSCGYSYDPDDTQKALAQVKSLVFKGLKDTEFSEAEGDRRKDDALALLKKCEVDALRLLEENKPILQRLATILEQKKILSAAQIEAVIKFDPQTPAAKQNPARPAISLAPATTPTVQQTPQQAAQIAPLSTEHPAVQQATPPATQTVPAEAQAAQTTLVENQATQATEQPTSAVHTDAILAAPLDDTQKTVTPTATPAEDKQLSAKEIDQALQELGLPEVRVA